MVGAVGAVGSGIVVVGVEIGRGIDAGMRKGKIRWSKTSASVCGEASAGGSDNLGGVDAKVVVRYTSDAAGVVEVLADVGDAAAVVMTAEEEVAEALVVDVAGVAGVGNAGGVADAEGAEDVAAGVVGVVGVVGFVGSVGVTGAGADTVIVIDLLTLSLESLLWSVISPDIDTV